MITASSFGKTRSGSSVTLFRLTDEKGAYIEILDYGATIRSLLVPDRDGKLVDVVLGYDRIEDYEAGTLFFGATVGRHANRIGGGRFTLNGKDYQLECNDGENHLHGGSDGWHQRLFRSEIDGDTLRLFLTSPDGDQGYPGKVELTVEYSFRGGCLSIIYRAKTDADTVINVTNHSYFDLSGGLDPMGQHLMIDADRFTENDAATLPTGTILDVAGTPLDFRNPVAIRDALAMEHIQLDNCSGLDHNFVLNHRGGPDAVLESPATGIRMTYRTNRPGTQLYSGNFIVGTPAGKGGKAYGKNDAICLESQFFPNAMAHAHFPSPVLKAGEEFYQTIEYAFDTFEG